MPSFFDLHDDWGQGVITSGFGDRIPVGASPRGRNSVLTGIGPDGKAVPAKRRGATVVNINNARLEDGGSDPMAIIAQYNYSKTAFPSSASFGNIPLQVAFEDSGTGLHLYSFGANSLGSFSSFSSTPVVSFATANNLCFITTGQQAYVTAADTLGAPSHFSTMGVTAPTSAPSLAVGAAGTPSGTYEARVTFYDSTLGTESSAGPTSSTVTVASQKIEFSSIPTSAQTGHGTIYRKIYLRNTSTQANFYLAATITDNSTTTLSYNQADTLLVLLGPDTDENDTPDEALGSTQPVTLCWHRSRMFIANSANQIYYSKIDSPEQFDPENYENVGEEDGRKITGLVSFGDALLIFKESSIYGLFGVDPNSWQMRLLHADIGCHATNSLVVAENFVYWWSRSGIYRMGPDFGTPENIGKLFLADSISVTNIPYTISAYAAADIQKELIYFAFPTDSTAFDSLTRNKQILVWSYRLNRWVTDRWTGLEAASLAAVTSLTNIPTVYMGTYGGQLWSLGDADNDAVPGGTTSGTFTAGGSSITTITSSGFYTTGNGLATRYVSVVASDGTLTGQRRIDSNTSTVLTLDSALTVTNGATYTFYVGGPAFEWDTREDDSQLPFHKKRYRHAHLQFADTAATVGVDIFVSFGTAVKKALSFSVDSSVATATTIRKAIGAVGTAWKMRIRNYAPDEPVTLYEVGVSGSVETPKIG